MYQTGKAAQISREMDKYSIDILGLSEVRWPTSGSLRLESGKYILYSGRSDGLHQEGVELMLTPKAYKSMMEWNPINERILTARFFSKFIKISIIQVYSPTNEATEEAKLAHLEQLQSVIETIPKHDMLLIMGDMNAKIGNNNTGHEDVMGNHALGVMNNNGEHLIDLCEINKLVVTGSLFPHKTQHKVTWTSPGGRVENQIDHVLVTKQHRTSVLDTRSMRGADIASDHELVRCKVRIKLRKHKTTNSEKRRIKYDTTKLQKPDIKKAFNLELRNRFSMLELDENSVEDDAVETSWKQMVDAFTETANDKLGRKEIGQKPWITRESWKKVDERRELKKRIENARSDRLKERLRTDYRERDKDVKRSMRSDRRKWTDNMIEEAEKAAQNGRMKTVYEITRTLCNEKRKESNLVKDKMETPYQMMKIVRKDGRNILKKH